MIFKMLKAERMKLKRSPVWIAFIIMPIIPALLGTINYLGNIEILQSEWYSLWTQHTLFTCYFFLPIRIGVYCCYKCIRRRPIAIGTKYLPYRKKRVWYLYQN